MVSNLDKLSPYLHIFVNNITKSLCSNDNECALLSKKEFFPSDYLCSWDRFKENKLPPIKVFYKQLRDCRVKKSDYKNGWNVWKTFNNHNLGKYNLECLKQYTVPNLAYTMFLNISNITLKLLRDVDQIMLIEKGIIG